MYLQRWYIHVVKALIVINICFYVTEFLKRDIPAYFQMLAILHFVQEVNDIW